MIRRAPGIKPTDYPRVANPLCNPPEAGEGSASDESERCEEERSDDGGAIT
jgi:hypothetical protein